jgi:phage terminase small subunit
MTQFTEKQQAFVDNKSAGVTNREAAIAAGYASTAAAVTAAKLMRRPDINAAIKTASKPGSVVTTPRQTCDAAQAL